ncbi:MAG: hypothetical protein ACOZNI_06040 [Myxococcota bacterium]
MTELVCAAAALVLVALLLAAVFGVRASLRTLADPLGLRWEDGEALTGERRGVPVRVERYQVGTGRSRWGRTRIVATGPPAGVRAARGATPGEHVTGDVDFDRAVRVEGDPARIAAALDAGTRRALAALVERDGGRVEDGAVAIDFAGWTDDVGRLSAAVERVTDVAARLSVPARDEVSRLRAIALEDPVPGARARALRSLRRLHGPEVAGPVATAALGDPWAAVRLTASLILGQPIDAFADETLHAYAPAAPAAIARGLAGDEARLAALLDVDDEEVAVAALEVLAEVGTVASIPRLAPLTTGVFANGRVKRAATGAILCIRDRVGDVDPGRLAVAEGEAGQVSVAEPGGVSVLKERP